MKILIPPSEGKSLINTSSVKFKNTNYKFNNEVKNILLLQSVLPIAVFNYLFAYRYKKNPEEIASLILSSVIFSMLALPIMLAIIL